jgi:hypothetical protein
MIMPEASPLMTEFLRWVTERPRTYLDVMDAWRTNCPRQSIWEDAQTDGLVDLQSDIVRLTTRGAAALSAATNAVPQTGRRSGKCSN